MFYFMSEIGRVDPRQLESIMMAPGVASRTHPAEMQRWGQHIGRERSKTAWTQEGNIILPTGEFIDRATWHKLPEDERSLLHKLGVDRFNEFVASNLKIEGQWYGKATPEHKILDAVRDGYTTMEEIAQVTGLTNAQIEKAVTHLQKGQYLQGEATEAPRQPRTGFADIFRPPASTGSKYQPRTPKVGGGGGGRGSHVLF